METNQKGLRQTRAGSVCESILRWARESAEGWTAGHVSEGHHLIVLTLFSRSTRTYDAIVRRLGKGAMGEQGLMLCRPLFEDMVDSHWVVENPEQAVDRLSKHDRYSRILRADVQRRFSERFFDGRQPPVEPATPEERSELRALFGKHGNKSWTGVPGTHERLKQILHRWPEEDRATVQFWEAWVYKLMNEVLHPSSFSLARLGAPTVDENDSFEWRLGATIEWLPQALHAAAWTYCQTLDLLLSEFKADAKPDLLERWDGLEKSFLQASAWEKDGVDPPPSSTEAPG